MRTTKKQFQLFADAVEHYAHRIGLGSWDIITIHENIGDSIAEAHMNYLQRRAWIKLNNTPHEKMTDEDVVGSALHECLHIYLYPLTYFFENPMAATREQLEAVEHEVINFVQKLIESRECSDDD